MVGERRETAGAIVFDDRGRALLGLRAAHKRVAAGCWDIIGGKVEADESVEQALERELREELGITVTAYRRIASLSDPDGPTVHHVFAVTDWTGGPPVNACDEHDAIRWFTLAEIDRLPNKTPFDFAALIDRSRAERGPPRRDVRDGIDAAGPITIS